MPDIVGTLKPPKLASAPTSPALGQMYFDTSTNKLLSWDGTSWVSASQGPMGPQGPAGPQGPQGPSVVDDTNLPDRLDSQYAQAPSNDLNQMTSGWCNSDSSTANRPSDNYCVVFTIKHAGGGIARQDAIETNGGRMGTRWQRVMWGSWTAWEKVYPVDDTNLPPRLKSLPYSGTAISDANNATAAGWYVCQASATANIPVNNWGQLTVATLNVAGSNIWQMYHSYSTDEVWQRRNADGAWQPWVKMYPIDEGGLPNRLKGVGQLLSDFNTTVSGFYHGGGGTVNVPPGTYGMYSNLFVSGDGDQQAGQICTFFWSAEVWYRRCHSGTWNPWVKIYPQPIDDTTLPTRLKSVSTEPADLNTVIENGWTYANSASNRPTGAGQWLIHTLMWGSNDYGKQVGYDLNSTEIWTRRRYGSAWNPWTKIAPIDDATLPTRLRSNSGSAAPIGDYNNAIASGFYYAQPSAANGPPGVNDMFVYVSAYNNSNYCSQIAIDLHQDVVFFRRLDAGSWSTWRSIYPGALPPRLERDTTTYGVSVSDWNNARENGFYQGQPGTTNAPDGSWYIGIVVAHRSVSPAYITQEVWEFTSSLQTPRWRRVCSNDAWQPWYRVWENDCGLAQNIPPGGAWVYFAKPFRYAPTVVATCTTWEGNGVTQAQIQNVDTGKFFLVHASGSTLNFQWIACGQ